MKVICGVLGSRVCAIEHIGSTSVPGLGGKNIIDIMVGVSGPVEANQCLLLLERIGYSEVTPQENNADWYYCLGKRQQRVGYHLHLVRFDSEHWKKQLIFRDFLRENHEVSQEYCRLKKELAAKFGADRLGYTEAKTGFIESTLACARQQATAQNRKH